MVATLKMFGDTLGMGKPQISGTGTGLQLLKCLGTLWGRGSPKFWGFFGGKSPKIPKSRGGGGGRNIGDFPTTNCDQKLLTLKLE